MYMETVEFNLCKSLIFDWVLKNMEINGYMKKQKTTRATF